VLVAQLFAFTPIAFMIMRGVVQGIAPSLEEAAQMLRADRRRTFFTITLPLLKPGLANAFLVGFIESIADFGNPVVVGGQFSVLSTDIFFAIVGAQYDQGRAASLAWVLTLFALGVFALQRGLLGKQNYTTVSGKGDAGIAMALPDGVRRTIYCIALPWIAFTAVVYLFAFAAASCRPGGATTPSRCALQDRLLARVGPVRAGVGGHGVELAVHHAQAGGHLGAAHRGAGPADRLAAGAQRVPGRASSSSARCWPLRFRARCWA
jgi:ABC-type Fe3+ transport system permease subunit